MAKPRLLVAVVDDEESVRKALRRLFRSAGMDVETFASGRDFLDYMKTGTPDCLVLDLHLPGLTGRDVQRCLNEAGAHLPVIVVTGQDQTGVREEMLAAGAVAFFTKPIDDENLLNSITKAVRCQQGHTGFSS